GRVRARARRVARCSIERRRVLSALLVPAISLIPFPVAAAAARIGSARIWPANEYTRVILESPVAIGHRLIALSSPPRIVLDLDGVEMTDELARLPALVAAADPYIARIRFGRQPPDVLRVVLDLREDVKIEL